MPHAWNDPAMGIQVSIDTGGVNGEIREALSHSLKSSTGSEGCHDPQAVAINTARLQLLQGLDQALSSGDFGSKDQNATAGIDLPGQPVEAESQVGNLG